jgi:hypothetical protein
MCLARVRVVASEVLPFEKRPEPEKPEAKADQSTKADVAEAKDNVEAKGEKPAPRPLPGEAKGSRGAK